MQARQLFFAMVCLAAGAHASACDLKLAREQWPPYVYATPQGVTTGLDWELAQAIAREAGCRLDAQPELPTARRQRLFEQGQLDLLLAASDTAARRQYARFSAPYRYEVVGLFTRSSRHAQYLHLGSLDALADARLPLLAPKVGWYGPAYARLQPALEASGQLSTFISFQQGIRMLDAGRADLILGDSGALRYEARAQGVAISPLPLVVLRAPVHLMLNKATTTPADLSRINAAIARLEHNGALGAIRARYGEP